MSRITTGRKLFIGQLPYHTREKKNFRDRIINLSYSDAPKLIGRGLACGFGSLLFQLDGFTILIPI